MIIEQSPEREELSGLSIPLECQEVNEMNWGIECKGSTINDLGGRKNRK